MSLGDTSTRPKNVDYFKVPDDLWERIKELIPERGNPGGRGRPAADNRVVLNGIWYVMWTGCQWKAIHRNWFGVCSSVLHERFQTWRIQGVFEAILKEMVLFYAEQREIGWAWQSIDSKSCPAPLGGSETGRNPTDRGKSGCKIHLLVDEHGAPLAVPMNTTNGRQMTSSLRLWSSALTRKKSNNICVPIEVMITMMCMRLLNRRSISPTLSTDEDGMKPYRKSVPSPANFVTRHDAG